MFVETYTKIEGILTYTSKWIEPIVIRCKVIIFIKDKKTKVIIFHKYSTDGGSPTNQYESLASVLYHERLSKADVKDIEWYLVHQEAKHVTTAGSLIVTTPIVNQNLFLMTMKWDGKEFRKGEFKQFGEEKMRRLIDEIDVPATSSDLIWKE